MAIDTEFVGQIFQRQDRVRTISALENRDYTNEGILRRKTNTEGIVIDLSNSHGLCFKVMHKDGSTAFYDADELIRLPNK